MKLKEILTPSFEVLRRELGLPREQKSMVEACRADDSAFCREVVARGWLTEEQMARAAERYLLGKSKSGRCIFWMIDEKGRVRDGHVVGGGGDYKSTVHGSGDASDAEGTAHGSGAENAVERSAEQEWVSVMLKAREPQLLGTWHAEHCLFGLHLLNATKVEGAAGDTQGTGGSGVNRRPVCVVKKEQSAVILSELFPECDWMAVVYATNLNEQCLKPLRGHQVTLFPPTDETMEAYIAWCEVARQANDRYRLRVEVNDILERHATPEQKRAGIDLGEFVFGGSLFLGSSCVPLVASEQSSSEGEFLRPFDSKRAELERKGSSCVPLVASEQSSSERGVKGR